MRTDPKPTSDPVFDVGVDWMPIAPQARLVWTLTAIAVATPVLLLAGVGLAVKVGAVGVAAGVAVSAAVLRVIWQIVERWHRSWGYSVHDDELLLRHGRIVRRLTIVPIGRMQFLDIEQGPLDRWLGVANLQLHTAAAASDAKVPMLSLEDAGRLRDELIECGAGRSGGT